jgi:hypothetical protein
MSALPPIMGRAVYAEVDEDATGDPPQQAAAWLARMEPWFGPCRTVGVIRHALGPTEVTVVSAGHDADSAVVVHLASGRPPGIGSRVRVEGSAATLQIEGGKRRLSNKQAVLDPGGVALPDADPARAALLNKTLVRAMASREVEKIDG